MYGVKDDDNKLVAIHDELPIVIKFMDEQPNHKYEIVKLSKKFMKKIKKTNDYTDLYLVRYNDKYIPYSVYETYKNATEGYIYDFKFAREILYRILEEDDMTNKERKCITKVISYISDKLEESCYDDISLDALKTMKLMDDEYKRKVNEE